MVIGSGAAKYARWARDSANKALTAVDQARKTAITNPEASRTLTSEAASALGDALNLIERASDRFARRGSVPTGISNARDDLQYALTHLRDNRLGPAQASLTSAKSGFDRMGARDATILAGSLLAVPVVAGSAHVVKELRR